MVFSPRSTCNTISRLTPAVSATRSVVGADACQCSCRSQCRYGHHDTSATAIADDDAHRNICHGGSCSCRAPGRLVIVTTKLRDSAHTQLNKIAAHCAAWRGSGERSGPTEPKNNNTPDALGTTAPAFGASWTMTDLLFLRPASGVARFSFSARWRAVYGLAAAVSRRIPPSSLAET